MRFLDQPPLLHGHELIPIDSERQESLHRRREVLRLPYSEYDHRPVLRRGAEQRPGEFILRSADPSYGVRSGRWGFSRGAGPNQFRTAPLWGLGQRLFFLHDGRTSDLLKAIENHASPGSEANTAIRIFNGLTESQQ